MQHFFIIGTAHLDNAELFRALESALDQAKPDQLILEIPDSAVLRGDVAYQKPEMVCAYRWAQRRGTPVRGHEPSGPPILRSGLRPERAGELIEAMDRLIADLSVRATIDLFCARREPATNTEEQLRAVIIELIDPIQAANRTTGVIEGVRAVAASTGKIVVVCGGAHVSHVADALPGARIIHGDYFF
ncbi:hypothetical protein [Phenylobacterium sp.]|uniref:hypothetical protein n=1 Tax=Phenylobacterium sp. TaxID=1871053 RepID=UPI0027330D26|nr:hypothetical protein [Phenylobacterium sp.]MDP3635152.1 hypothetical protein [Phenylobacterium sp.]